MKCLMCNTEIEEPKPTIILYGYKCLTPIQLYCEKCKKVANDFEIPFMPVEKTDEPDNIKTSAMGVLPYHI